MRSQKMMRCPGKIPAGFLMLVFLSGVVSVVSLSAFQGDASASLGKMKSMATYNREERKIKCS